jgi:hypothetical protein
MRMVDRGAHSCIQARHIGLVGIDDEVLRGGDVCVPLGRLPAADE